VFTFKKEQEAVRWLGDGCGEGSGDVFADETIVLQLQPLGLRRSKVFFILKVESVALKE